MTDAPDAPETPKTPGAWRKGLEHRQIRFVEEYLVDLNATQAVVRSGYKVSNLQSASSIGHDNLRKPAIAAAIAMALDERWGVTKARIVEEYAKIAFANFGDFAVWDETGLTVKPSSEIGEDKLAAVCEISETSTATARTKRIKTHDKLAALQGLGKVVGLFTDKHQLSGPDGEPLAPEASTRDLARAVLDILRTAQIAPVAPAPDDSSQ